MFCDFQLYFTPLSTKKIKTKKKRIRKKKLRKKLQGASFFLPKYIIVCPTQIDLYQRKQSPWGRVWLFPNILDAYI